MSNYRYIEQVSIVSPNFLKQLHHSIVFQQLILIPLPLHLINQSLIYQLISLLWVEGDIRPQQRIDFSQKFIISHLLLHVLHIFLVRRHPIHHKLHILFVALHHLLCVAFSSRETLVQVKKVTPFFALV